MERYFADCGTVDAAFCSPQSCIMFLLQSGEAESGGGAGIPAACPAAHSGPAGAAQARLGVMQAKPCS